jgi:hypothetical protein
MRWTKFKIHHIKSTTSDCISNNFFFVFTMYLLRSKLIFILQLLFIIQQKNKE